MHGELPNRLAMMVSSTSIFTLHTGICHWLKPVAALLGWTGLGGSEDVYHSLTPAAEMSGSTYIRLNVAEKLAVKTN